MFEYLIVCKQIIAYMWLPVCLISIKQSLLFFITRVPLNASLHFSLVVWLFVCWQTRKNANMYDWKQTCLHLAFLFLYPCDAFHIYFLFCKTATMYVRIWSRILSVVGQRKCLRVTNNAIQRALGWSFSQTLCKDNHFGGEFSFFIQ